MINKRLNGAGTQCSLDDPKSLGGLTIAFSQPIKVGGAANSARWRCRVAAKTASGAMRLGSFVVCPPPEALPGHSRVVAIATMPGALSWSCFVDLVGGDSDNGEISLALGGMAGEPGLVRVGERYAYRAGVNGALNLLAGETVLGWAAIGDTGGGSITIDGGSSIIVPEGVSVSGGPGGTLEGPTAFVFTDTVSYLVELALSA
jgi:hypothetical protein